MNLRVISIGAHHIMLTWDIQRDPRIIVEAYDIRYFIDTSMSEAAENRSSVFTQQTNYTFLHLAQQTKYSFQVMYI